MRSNLAIHAVLLSSFATVAVAQNVTVPAALAGVEGGGGTNVPFGSNQACRYQCIYDAEELPWVGPRLITGIMLRADTSATLIPAKGFLDISVLVSTTDKTAATASNNFAENRGLDATWVIVNQVMQLPAQPVLTVGPRAANIPLLFTVPWAYGLTPATSTMPAPRSLLIELHIHSQPSGTYRLDNLGGCVAPQASFGSQGPACTVPGQPPVTIEGDVSMLAGSSYAWNVANMPPSMPFFVSLNLTNNGGLFGQPSLPLPYPMFDQTNPALPSPALAFLGWPAPDCWLNVDPVVFLGGLADTSGAGQAAGILPPGRNVVGQTFYAQAIVIAPTANPLRMVTSLGRSATVCGPLGVARIHAFYNGAAVPPPTPPAVGIVQTGVGLVFDVL